MPKLDFKITDKKLYLPPTTPVLVTVPKMVFFAVDGKGAPDGPDFQNAVKALYSMTFTIKFMLKFAKVGKEYTVPPLEGLWWMPGNKSFNQKTPSRWLWRAMIRQPEFVTAAHMKQAIALMTKRGKMIPVVKKVKRIVFAEGLSVQVMHIGPYGAERPNLKKMEDFAIANHLTVTGKHHEIYLGDPRRIAPAKLKTVLRHPVK